MCGWFGASCGSFEWRGEQQKADFIFSNSVLVFVCLFFFFPTQHFRSDASMGGHEGDDDSNKTMKMSVPTRDMFVCHALSMEHFIHPLHDLMCTLTLSPFYR